jgi:hypothetical protein
MKKLFLISLLFISMTGFTQQQTLNNGDALSTFRSKLNSNFTELYSRSNWNTTGGTTINSPTITGNATFTGDQTINGKLSTTKTETAIVDARPVINAWTYLVQPSSAPGSSVDYHGLDMSMTSSGNTNTNTRLYPLELTTGHSGTGTLGLMVNIFTNSRNTSSGNVTDIFQIRQRVQNTGSGTISNIYARRVEAPSNSGGGSITNFYGDYIENVTQAGTNWGLYSLMAGNFAEGFTIGSSGLRMENAANSCFGDATLVGGTVTINNTKVTANSKIFFNIQTAGGTIGVQAVSARTPGTSFTITSTSGTDTSTISWFIIEPY